MRTLYCHHCGAKLPDNANFCPECGEKTALNLSAESSQPKRDNIPTPEPDMIDEGMCLVTRKTGTTTFRKTKIFIDGVDMGEVGEGETLPLTLKAGEHSLTMQTGKREKMAPIIIGPGDSTIFHFKCTDGSFEKDNSRHKILKNELLPHTVGAPAYVRQMQSPTTASPISVSAPSIRTTNNIRLCPRCNGPMMIQTVSESRKSGCGTILLYIILCLTILGILIVIPLALRKKTETVTYAVCQNCGYRERRFGSL